MNFECTINNFSCVCIFPYNAIQLMAFICLWPVVNTSNFGFDLIMNVESSHCYGNRKDFFKELVRKLKPSGYFLYADFRSRINYLKRQAQLEGCGLRINTEQEITHQVLKSMELTKEYKEALLKKMVLKPFLNSIADFVGLPGSNIYNKFESGDAIYFSIVCRKES